jgi:hypothetical protein
MTEADAAFLLAGSLKILAVAYGFRVMIQVLRL